VEKSLREHLRSRHAALVDRIEASKDLSKDDEKALHDAVKEFKKSAGY
jgi:F-type H+-transporting ATPase subunit alpha